MGNRVDVLNTLLGYSYNHMLKNVVFYNLTELLPDDRFLVHEFDSIEDKGSKGKIYK